LVFIATNANLVYAFCRVMNHTACCFKINGLVATLNEASTSFEKHPNAFI